MNDKNISEKRLELALEAAGLDLWENDLLTGDVPLKATKTFIELGYSEDEIASFVDDLFKIIHPDDVPAVKIAVNNHLAGTTSQYRCEFRIRAKNGAWVWYANYGRIMDDGIAGRGHRFIGVTFNIDDRKHRESELEFLNYKLAEQNALLRKSEKALMEFQLVAGIGTYEMDITTGIWESSAFLDKLFGISKAYDRTVDGWAALIYPDDRRMMWDYFKNEVLGKKESFDKEYRIIRHNDLVVRWLHGLGHLELSPKGIPVKMMGTIQDITERKQAEIRIKDTDDAKLRTLSLLNAIANGSADAIFAKDIEGRYILCNREMLRQIGKVSEDVIGKKDEEIYSSENAAVISEGERAALRWEAPITFEEKLINVDGERIFLTTKGALKDEDANIYGIFGISHDITERKNAERLLSESFSRLEEKEQSKSRFLAAAGHDLRQPLAAANLFIDALKYTGTTPEQSKIIGRLDTAMSNFGQLLDALLNVSKLDSGVITPEFTSITVADIFLWLEDIFAPMASEKGLRFDLYFSTSKELVVHSDVNLLKSVLSNLVVNAIKYTSKGAVLISARQRGQQVLFQVWDTGIGISNKNIEKIFCDFYQVDNPQRDRERGLGLGLSIAKRALALIDGSINCRSKVGSGSVFEFQLPLETNFSSGIQSSSTLSGPIAPEVNDFVVQGKHFVVIEDDSLLSEAICNVLRMMGGEVTCFSSAESALEHSHIGDADCYIVDYMLSGKLDGAGFLFFLKQRIQKPICAVMISGDTSSDFIRKAERFDWPVMQKPVKMEKLLSMLRVSNSKTALI